MKTTYYTIEKQDTELLWKAIDDCSWAIKRQAKETLSALHECYPFCNYRLVRRTHEVVED